MKSFALVVFAVVLSLVSVADAGVRVRRERSVVREKLFSRGCSSGDCKQVQKHTATQKETQKSVQKSVEKSVEKSVQKSVEVAPVQ